MTYKLNNKSYEIKEINFKEVLEMEKCGLNLLSLGSNDISFTNLVSMVRYITNLDEEKAIKEIEEHLNNGGTMVEAFECFKALETSSFFKKLVENK